MRASIVDLRYKMKDVLKALDKNETITVFYHGKEKAEIISLKKKINKKITSHPFFGMSSKETKKSVTKEIDELRGPRYNDI